MFVLERVGAPAPLNPSAARFAFSRLKGEELPLNTPMPYFKALQTAQYLQRKYGIRTRITSVAEVRARQATRQTTPPLASRAIGAVRQFGEGSANYYQAQAQAEQALPPPRQAPKAPVRRKSSTETLLGYGDPYEDIYRNIIGTS